jgi:hypothetical protein
MGGGIIQGEIATTCDARLASPWLLCAMMAPGAMDNSKLILLIGSRTGCMGGYFKGKGC